MILSRLHNFVFVKGMKVAGTSVEIALSTVCGLHDIVTPISPIDERERLARGGRAQNYANDRAAEQAYLDGIRDTAVHDLARVRHPASLYFNHMPLSTIAELQGAGISSMRIACVERLPYAKALSWANMQLSYHHYRAGGQMRADIGAIRDFVDQSLENGRIRDTLNIGRYRWPAGSLAAIPMRYEYLQQDFTAFVRSLGLAQVPELPHVKKGMMSNTFDPRGVFRRDQIARINDIFAEEFSAFGYEML